MDFDMTLFSSMSVEQLSQKARLAFEVGNHNGGMKLSKSYDASKASLDFLVSGFLDEVEAINDEILNDSSLLQVGVYYQSEEHAFFTVRLSEKCMQKLGQKRVSIEICAYPCSEN